MERVFISVVSPVYRAESLIDELTRRLTDSITSITQDYEIILVNDSSPDKSWEKIIQICAKDSKVKGINLSRNFGQHYAITAGLGFARGEWVVVMDCDLQDRPEEIPRLYQKAQEGFDIVYARRIARKDDFIKRSTSSIFHRVFSHLSGMKSDKTIANFGIYRSRVIEEFNKMPEQARFFPSQIKYLGFKDTAINVEHSERPEGKSSYNLGKRIKLGLEVIVSNSNKPLRFAVGLGFIMSLLAFLLALYNLVAKWTGVIQVPGFTTTVFSIWFVGGLLLFVLGITGLYIGKIYDQVKGRQLFIIKDRINL